MKKIKEITDIKEEILKPLNKIHNFIKDNDDDIYRADERRFLLWLFLDLKTKVTQKLREITNLDKIRNMGDADIRKITFYLYIKEYYKDIDIKQYGENIKDIPDNTNYALHRYESQILGELESDGEVVDPLIFNEKYFDNMYMPFSMRLVNYGPVPTNKNPQLFIDTDDKIQIIGKNRIIVDLIAKIVDEIVEKEYSDLSVKLNFDYLDLNEMDDDEKQSKLYHYSVHDLTLYGYDFFNYKNMMMYLEDELEGYIVHRYFPFDPRQLLKILQNNNQFKENPIISASMNEIYHDNLHDEKLPISGPYTEFYDIGITEDGKYYVYNFNYSEYHKNMFWSIEKLEERYKKALKKDNIEVTILPLANIEDYYSTNIIEQLLTFLTSIDKKETIYTSTLFNNFYYYKNY